MKGGFIAGTIVALRRIRHFSKRMVPKGRDCTVVAVVVIVKLGLP